MASRFIGASITDAERDGLLNQAIADLGDVSWKG
jgi:hypothetical protein